MHGRGVVYLLLPGGGSVEGVGGGRGGWVGGLKGLPTANWGRKGWRGWRFEWSTYSFLEVKGGGRGWGWSGWRFESEW